MTARPSTTILLVEADRERGGSLAAQLLADGYAVEHARNAEHARILARTSSPGLALLGDLDSPRGALALVHEIRSSVSGASPWDRRMPLVVTGPRPDELAALRAFEAGADDFVTRHASYLELRARIRAVLRRTSACADERRWRHVGPLAVDTHTRTARLDGRPLELRRIEFDLLAHMASEPTRVFSREELLRNVWGYRSPGSTRTLASHASRLRRKLQLGSTRRWLVNVRGVGYSLI